MALSDVVLTCFKCWYHKQSPCNWNQRGGDAQWPYSKNIFIIIHDLNRVSFFLCCLGFGSSRYMTAKALASQSYCASWIRPLPPAKRGKTLEIIEFHHYYQYILTCAIIIIIIISCTASLIKNQEDFLIVTINRGIISEHFLHTCTRRTTHLQTHMSQKKERLMCASPRFCTHTIVRCCNFLYPQWKA